MGILSKVNLQQHGACVLLHCKYKWVKMTQFFFWLFYLKFKQPFFGVEITKNEDGQFNWTYLTLIEGLF